MCIRDSVTPGDPIMKALEARGALVHRVFNRSGRGHSTERYLQGELHGLQRVQPLCQWISAGGQGSALTIRQYRAVSARTHANAAWRGGRMTDPSEERSDLYYLIGVWKSFASQIILRGIDLRLGRGETLGIIGPSGAGK